MMTILMGVGGDQPSRSKDRGRTLAEPVSVLSTPHLTEVKVLVKVELESFAHDRSPRSRGRGQDLQPVRLETRSSFEARCGMVVQKNLPPFVENPLGRPSLSTARHFTDGMCRRFRKTEPGADLPLGMMVG